MERYLVLLWFKRFDTVNKGIMRLFAVCLIVTCFIIAGEALAADRIPLFIVCYITLILFFRILLWIYDGIVGNE
jgi:lipopolysaccharide export LptBFGC system permease protein LptF